MQMREHTELESQVSWGHVPWNVLTAADVPIVAVAGASGKSTTTTLLRAMLRSAGLRTFGGLQGLLERADRLTPRDRVVLALDWPAIAEIEDVSVLAITGLAADELASGIDVDRYLESCRRLANGASDVIVNGDDAHAVSAVSMHKSIRRVSLTDTSADAFLRDEEILLRDDGMVRRAGSVADERLGARPFATDLLVAAATAIVAGADAADVRRVAARYRAPADHFELAGTVGGVAYVNDAAATSPGRTAAVLASFAEPVLLIGGGAYGGQSLQRWSRLATSKTHRVLLYGSAGAAMAEAMASARSVETIVRCADLDDAVDIARRIAVPGDIVVLSPGCVPEGRKPGPRFRELVAGLQVSEAAA